MPWYKKKKEKNEMQDSLIKTKCDMHFFLRQGEAFLLILLFNYTCITFIRIVNGRFFLNKRIYIYI